MAEAASREPELLAALPQLSADDLMPEITSLKLDARGRLERVERQAPVILTYTQMGRRVTGRFAFGEHARMEVGCRLARIPYTVEGPLARDRLLATVHRIQRARVGRLAITHRRELHLSDRIDLAGQPVGAVELFHALLIVGLALRPVFAALDEIGLPRPGTT
jgi:hypothetical protein